MSTVERVVARYEGGAQADAVLRSTGEVVQAVLAQLGYGPKVRHERTDRDHIAALKESGGEWPPIVVTGAEGHIIDGHHRATAAREMGWTTIPAVVVEVDIKSLAAHELAFAANDKHGLPYSLSERKSFARKLINESDYSDRLIATKAGISRPTVANLRPPRAGGSSLPPARPRVGADGRTYPTPEVAAARRQQAIREVEAKPKASNRQVASASGLSPGTVANLRRRIEAGEDPVPPRLRAVSPPETEPEEPPKASVNDVLPSVPSDWTQHPASNRTNDTREFMRFMNRWGRVVKFQEERKRLSSMCPPDAKDEAVRAAQWMAKQWTTFAEELQRSGGLS